LQDYSANVSDHTSCYEAFDMVDRIVPTAALKGNQAMDGDEGVSVEVWSAPRYKENIHKMSRLRDFLGDWPARQAYDASLLERWEKGEVGIDMKEVDSEWRPTPPGDQFVCWSEVSDHPVPFM
jgi:hypothetical protein